MEALKPVKEGYKPVHRRCWFFRTL